MCYTDCGPVILNSDISSKLVSDKIDRAIFLLLFLSHRKSVGLSWFN